MAGFNVLRQAGDGELTTLNSELLFAQNAGMNQGAAYSFIDTTAPEGVLIYVLEAVKLDGSMRRWVRLRWCADKPLRSARPQRFGQGLR